MKIGFTGTRQGLTAPQYRQLREWIDGHYGEIIEWHHGCCVGADEQGVVLVDELLPLARIIAHPPLNPIMQSQLALRKSMAVREPLDYLVRNRCIVAECDYLVACPKEYEEQKRSGTWATVRYAREANRPMTVIHHSGSTCTSGSRRFNHDH